MSIQSKKIDVLNIISVTLVSLFCISIFIPFLMVINQSFMTYNDIIRHGYTLIPRSFSMISYKYLLVDNDFIYWGFAVSVAVAVGGTALNLLFTSTLAYALSKNNLPYRKAINFMVFFTMLFTGGLIPTYLVVTGLKLGDSLWALILPVLITPWNMFLLRNFFNEIPDSIEESAAIDGASPLYILFRIIIPISMAAIATIGLFYAVSHWNSWFPAAIYIRRRRLWPLQLILRQIIISMSPRELGTSLTYSEDISMPMEGVRAAAIMVVSLPIISIYPFLQKHFIKGIMVGSIKG